MVAAAQGDERMWCGSGAGGRGEARVEESWGIASLGGWPILASGWAWMERQLAWRGEWRVCWRSVFGAFVKFLAWRAE